MGYSRKIQFKNSNACIAWYSLQIVCSGPLARPQLRETPAVAEVVVPAAATQRTQKTKVTASSTMIQLVTAERRMKSITNLLSTSDS